MDAHQLARRLMKDAAEIAQMLLPAGKRVGHEWCVGSVAGEQGQSLKICLVGVKQGIWADFSEGIGGDILDLWRLVKGLPTVGEALKQVRDWYGIEQPTFVTERKKYKRPAPPKDLAPAKKGTVVEEWLRTERGFYPETIRRWQVTEAPEWRGINKEKKEVSYKGPWIVWPVLKPIDGKMTLVNLKWRHLKPHPETGKKIFIQEGNAEPSCIGWHLAEPAARKLIICEGEPDAMAWDQVLREANLPFAVTVVSTPIGGGTADKQMWIDNDWDLLDQYDDIYLSFDNDRPGDLGAEECAKRLGRHRCRRIRTYLKDANDSLLAGHGPAEFCRYMASAELMKPAALVGAEHFFEEVAKIFDPPHERPLGMTLPWSKFKVQLRPGEVTVVTGITGHGKSILMGQVALWVMDLGEKCCIASMEMMPGWTLERMTRQATQLKKPSREEQTRFKTWLTNKLWIYNVFGSVERDDLLADMTYARRRFGCWLFIIDSLMRVGIKSDDYEGQDNFVKKLCAFAESEQCHVVLIVHPRKQEDESRQVGKMSIKGSGGITDNAYNVLEVWRNKSKESRLQAAEELTGDKRDAKIADVAEKCDAKITCWKQRNGGGWEGSVKLWYQRDLALYRENDYGQPPALLSFVPLHQGEGPQITPSDEDLMALAAQPQ